MSGIHRHGCGANQGKPTAGLHTSQRLPCRLLGYLLPIRTMATSALCQRVIRPEWFDRDRPGWHFAPISDEGRSEEHTSELQSHRDLHSFPTRRSSDLASTDMAAAPIKASQPLASTLRNGSHAGCWAICCQSEPWQPVHFVSVSSGRSGSTVTVPGGTSPQSAMRVDRKSTRLNSSHTEIYTLSLHDALPIWHPPTWLRRQSRQANRWPPHFATAPMPAAGLFAANPNHGNQCTLSACHQAGVVRP